MFSLLNVWFSRSQHELVVRAEGGGLAVMSLVQVTVVDVNDNPPHFLQEDMTVTVVEEDDQHLPATIFKVSKGQVPYHYQASIMQHYL